MSAPPPARPGQPLTPRELQVVTAMANGHGNAQIADDLGLVVNTIKSHSSRIYRKLGARDRAHAVALAIATRQIAPRRVAIVHPPQA